MHSEPITPKIPADKLPVDHTNYTMVFFSCDGCAEMLKKSQVDGHAARCRRCASVSCVDCSVSFFGGLY
jgi:hypothetical protein